MKPWMYTVIGVVSWCAFVDVIAPDISWARNLIAGFIGLTAVMFIAGGVSKSINVHPKDSNAETPQDETSN